MLSPDLIFSRTLCDELFAEGLVYSFLDGVRNLFSGKQLSARLAMLSVACLHISTINAQALPDHTVEIANGVYSYGPGDSTTRCL